jgi:outer membrane lipoprotein-sorting protein
MWARRATRLIAALAVAAGITTTAAATDILKGSAATAEAQAAARQLGKVETLAAEFDMLTVSGLNQGRIFVDRPREAIRVEFDPPLGHLILVNGARTQFFGGEGTAVETATSGTPFAFLMNPEEALDSSVDILQVTRQDENVTIAVAERGNKSNGQIILKFKGDGAWRLVEWGMFDKEGGFTQTRLRNVRTGAAMDGALFRAPEREELNQ